MLKRMLLLLTITVICFGQSNLNNDLDGNPISFHGIIPDKTTYSEAYDHLKYVVGLDDLKVKEYTDGSKYLFGTKVMEDNQCMIWHYFVDFLLDAEENPTVESIWTRVYFCKDEWRGDMSTMSEWFGHMEASLVSVYGDPTETHSEKAYRYWSFSSDTYESHFTLRIQSNEHGYFFMEVFDGKYR